MAASTTEDPGVEQAHLAELGTMLASRLSQDPQLVRLLELAGLWLIGLARRVSRPPATLRSTNELATATSQETDVPGAEAADGSPVVEAELKPEPATTPAAIEPELLTQLLQKFAQPTVSPTVRPPAERSGRPGGARPRASTQGLDVLARRMELKADACAWAIRRLDQDLAGTGFIPVKADDDRLRTRADSLQPCYLWMTQKDAQSIDRESWVRLEGCYRSCAEVLRTVVEFPEAYEAGPELLKLLGEAQSAVRAGMEACGAFPRFHDLDQQAVFEWCREEGGARRVFNPFLALDQLADPSLHGGLLARVRRISEDLRARRDRAKEVKRGLNTIRYHVGQLQDSAVDIDHQWTRIAEGVDQVLSAGERPSMPELVQLLVPLADEVPASVCGRPSMRQVLRHVDERVAATERGAEAEIVARRGATPDVLLVREALRGTTMVLIGGTRRPHSQELLAREFELGELDWLSAAEHESVSVFEPSIARAETRVVVLMIRWSSHSFEEVREMCRRHGKVFVRLPGGYNPAQVAHQIVEQASGQLGLARA